MKPIVIFVGKEGTVTLTREELEKYLQEAYNAGHDDGYAEGYSAFHPNTITWPFNKPDYDPDHYKQVTWSPHIEDTIRYDTSNSVDPGFGKTECLKSMYEQSMQ